MAGATIDLAFSLDLRAVGRGIEGATLGDATGRELWWATDTPQGSGTLHVVVQPPLSPTTSCSTDVRVEGFGPGGEWVVSQAPALLGGADRPEQFQPAAGLVAELHRRAPVRFGRTDRVFDALVAAIIGQKVPVVLASEALRRLTRRFGEPAPGPTPRPLTMRPTAERLAGVSVVEFHQVGLERKRAEIIRAAARRARALEQAGLVGPAELHRRLLTIPGVGRWTSALVRVAALGDADAVAVGDFHLAHHVCWALAGEPRGSDARMLELLEPYRGQRGRVVALLRGAGYAAPRRGPRLALYPLAAFDRRAARLTAR